jgi:small redox-active disulfide protein 2
LSSSCITKYLRRLPEPEGFLQGTILNWRKEMEIQVCGPGCANCEKTLKIVEAAVAATGVVAVVTKVTDFQEIAKLGIFSTPAVVIDGEVRCVGNVPKQADVEGWLSA